ncbi:MAG: YebC/PmpR family DNA-binding transcriptional regulator [Spirochaetales bacterium]|uniref:Probable transcriptional regulatory protein PQJ61_04335 n=1 Tax=Candidatus Thalassospirochaeta sargassi TaxID=3119039 RepID=A0AAJ1IB68_9SPIO|nr:YebC/PmpR family DNA-binding transcriptional regulator [Spirochaetales bacterium]
MSGHSKWHTIKHKKGAADAKRGKIFTKIIKEITVAARMGGGDIEANPRLRTIVLKAKDANMPKDNIERAIKKGTGDLEGVSYTEGMYEGYGLGGVAILVETLTDNKNRTAADVRSIFTKAGGNLGESGSVSYMFNRKGVITLSTETCDEDAVFNAALEAGAEDVVTEDGIIEVMTDPQDFESVRDALEEGGFKREMAEVSMIADQMITLDDEKTRKVLKLIEKLEDNDDVQNVYSNMDLPEDFDPEAE